MINTVQDLIDELNKIEDKNLVPIVNNMDMISRVRILSNSVIIEADEDKDNFID